jgi:uncharacterized membrane protein
MTNFTGVYWPVGAGTIVRLEGTLAVPQAISADGSVIVGGCYDTDNVTIRPARWDNGVLTLLAPLSGVTDAIGCSDDASVIIGYSRTSGGSMCYWTSGGTVAHALPPLTGDTGVNAGFGVPFTQRRISADGTKIIGQSAPSLALVLYTSGTPSSLGTGHTAVGLSADGSTVVAVSNDLFQQGEYWRGSWTTLSNEFGSTGVQSMLGTNADGTVFFAYFGGFDPAPPGYWNSSGVPSEFTRGTSVSAGITGNAIDSNVTVGYLAPDLSTVTPAKWVVNTRTDLTTGSYTTVQPVAVSGDGEIIAASAYTDIQHAAYYDSGDALHGLPDLGTLGSEPLGISRGGTVIYGMSYEEDAPVKPSCAALWTLDTIPSWPPG